LKGGHFILAKPIRFCLWEGRIGASANAVLNGEHISEGSADDGRFPPGRLGNRRMKRLLRWKRLSGFSTMFQFLLLALFEACFLTTLEFTKIPENSYNTSILCLS
jgi:hypothetical protein